VAVNGYTKRTEGLKSAVAPFGATAARNLEQEQVGCQVFCLLSQLRSCQQRRYGRSFRQSGPPAGSVSGNGGCLGTWIVKHCFSSAPFFEGGGRVAGLIATLLQERKMMKKLGFDQELSSFYASFSLNLNIKILIIILSIYSNK